MKSKLILALALCVAVIGSPQLLGDELPNKATAGRQIDSTDLAPIVSAGAYPKSKASQLWGSYESSRRGARQHRTASFSQSPGSADEPAVTLPPAPNTPGEATPPRELPESQPTAPSADVLPTPTEDPFDDDTLDLPPADTDTAAPVETSERPVGEEPANSMADETRLHPLEEIPTPPLGVGMTGMHLACGSNCMGDCPCQPCCLPHWRTFGDFLMMRPTNAEVPYAETINGAIVQPPNTPLQLSPIATAEPDFEPGLRVGASRVFGDCSDITLTYTHLDTNTFSDVRTDPPLVIRSLVRHPGDQTAAIDNLFAEARYDISFQMVDLDYRDVWKSCPWYSISYLVGLRYSHLKQDFASEFSSLGTEYVSTAIDFDGGGLRVGLEGERRLGCTGLSVYGRGVANFLGGEFTGTYRQSNTFAGTVVDTSWKAQRIVSILD